MGQSIRPRSLEQREDLRINTTLLVRTETDLRPFFLALKPGLLKLCTLVESPIRKSKRVPVGPEVVAASLKEKRSVE